MIYFQAIALAKAREDAAVEQEKVIKKLKKAHERALKVGTPIIPQIVYIAPLNGGPDPLSPSGSVHCCRASGPLVERISLTCMIEQTTCIHYSGVYTCFGLSGKQIF